MRDFLKGIIITVLSLGIILSVGCGGQEQAEASKPTDTTKKEAAKKPAAEPIKIAIAVPITGDSAQFGHMAELGANIALEEINSAGGIKGRPAEVIFCDDAAQPQEALSVAQKNVANKDIVAVVGHYNSGCSIPARSIYDEGGLMMLSPASTNADFAKDSQWAFRNIFNDRFQGQTIARYIKNQLGLNKVAVFYDNDSYGSPLKDFFSEEAEKLGLEIVVKEAYEKETIDFSPQLTKIKKLNPEIIFVAGLYAHGGRIVAKARELGIGTQIIGSDGLFSADFIKLAGEAGEGTIISCPFVEELAGEKGKAFSDKFKSEYNEEPDAWAVLTYDAVKMVYEVIDKAGTDRKAIRDAMAEINTPEKAFQGVGGPVYFDENGDCKKPIQMTMVKDGAYAAAPKQMPVE